MLWGSSTADGRTVIEFVPTKAPVEALAHELLHADLKLKGYQQFTSLVALAPKERRQLYLTVLSMLDNELQHHRMFRGFTALGLSKKRFYNDTDKNTYREVRREVEELQKGDHPAEFLLQFASVIAPGGAGDEAQRQPLKNFVKTRCTPETWRVLVEVEGLIEKWRLGTSLDVTATVRDILRLVAGEDRLWFGPTGCTDLALGQFTDVEFTIEEATTYLQGG